MGTTRLAGIAAGAALALAPPGLSARGDATSWALELDFGSVLGAPGEPPAAPPPAAASSAAEPGEMDATAIAKKLQNPVANLISLPIQWNVNTGFGPSRSDQNVVNIQPVIPFHVTEDWNLITRTILPIISTPVPDWEAGLGDMVWSFAGQDDRPGVNQMTFQPFVNYNFHEGWYLTFSPIVTGNWEADPGDQWTVPIGIGVGKVFKIGDQVMNAQIAPYFNVVSPDIGPEWTIRFQLAFVFPE